jgi:hypothetical protein
MRLAAKNQYEATMRTALIEGMQPSAFDKDLLQDLERIQLPPDTSPKDAYLIGVRDEHGDVYRAIDIVGASNATYLLEKLRELGYLDEAPNSYEAELGYDRILSVLKVAKLRR